MAASWKKLNSLALEEVEATLAELPAPLRERAQALPVTFERLPNAAQRLILGVTPRVLMQA